MEKNYSTDLKVTGLFRCVFGNGKESLGRPFQEPFFQVQGVLHVSLPVMGGLQGNEVTGKRDRGRKKDMGFGTVPDRDQNTGMGLVRVGRLDSPGIDHQHQTRHTLIRDHGVALQGNKGTSSHQQYAGRDPVLHRTRFIRQYIPEFHDDPVALLQ